LRFWATFIAHTTNIMIRHHRHPSSLSTTITRIIIFGRDVAENGSLRLKDCKSQVTENFGYLVSVSSRLGLSNLL